MEEIPGASWKVWEDTENSGKIKDALEY